MCTYETARDVLPRGLDHVEAASEYLRLFATDPGLAAGFRVGYRRISRPAQFAAFRRAVRAIEGSPG